MSEVFDGVRVSEAVDGENYYIVVDQDDDGVINVNITLPDENKFSMEKRRSNSEALAALASLASELGASVELIMDTINTSLVSLDSEAAMISRAIERFLEEKKVQGA